MMNFTSVPARSMARTAAILITVIVGLTSRLHADDIARVKDAMQKAATFYMNEVAVHGGYVYYSTPDGSRRLGEGEATATQIWVQPPGTPTVGMALLDAWHATHDPSLLKGATDAAEALIYGQLKSGGWTSSIDFNPKGQTGEYLNGKGRGRNFSTLDDGTTQGALQLLMKVDAAHQFSHKPVHQAVQTALEAMLAAQFSNGAFPQGWDDRPNPDQPVLKASFPDYDWKTEERVKEYWRLYTLNDGASGTITETLLTAHQIYADGKAWPGIADRCMASLKKFGDFLILAQLPEPQPTWAQQYTYRMRPAWARRFEPPAVTGNESQDVLRTLIRIARVTGDDRYLKPIPAALKWFERSILPDGQVARYYELQTNRPLYMNREGKEYFLTYDDTDLPSHYSWKTSVNLPKLTDAWKDALEHKPVRATKGPGLQEVQQIIEKLDPQGRWVSHNSAERLFGQAKFAKDEGYLSSQEFSKNLTRLAEFITHNR
ncbi:MAG: pectate lyase [Planctomycetaceae bacterium]